MNKYITTIILVFTVLSVSSQEETKYRRSSLYSMLISHPSQQFDKEITGVFFTIPVPDKFNNHDLSVKIVSSDEKRQEKLEVINSFIEKNALPRRMVGKWFDRDPETGYFDMNLIADRGQYDASYFDVNIAKMSARGTAQLADAGEELIGNTYLIVNDIKYLDKADVAKTSAMALKIGGQIAGAAMGNSYVTALTDKAGDLVASIKGFKVTVTTYLYRLDWNDEVAATLYTSYYITEQDFDAKKKEAFNDEKKLFKMKYIGKQSVNSGNTSIEGLNTETPEQMIRKVCTRAIDKSIVELQRAHEEFRVKTPLFSTGPTITAKIGMKEGVDVASKFEVLEQSIDKNGKTEYKRVGVIKPVPGKIWDNRYMAVEEKAVNANLTGTEFRKVSGGDFMVGMLIREIK